MTERRSRFGGFMRFSGGEILAECERVLVAHDALDRCASLEPRQNEAQQADLRIRFADRAWLRSADGLRLVDDLRSRPLVADAVQRRSDLFLNFEPAALAELEERLAAGDEAGMASADILAGRRFDVSLVGPNANKALHLGHLRNVALGQALACSLTAAGAQVRRRSLVADVGRRVCEAMAGYMDAYSGKDPRSEGLSGDRFVELCSRAFQATSAQGRSRSTSGPNCDEDESQGDTADRVMAGWLGGHEQERALWEQMKRWVLAGHERTLDRLGVTIDEYDFESAEIPRALDLVERGLKRGLFEREPTGGVVYRTGRPEYATMVLLNEEGTPTECARVLAVCHRMIEELDPEVEFWEILGDEWRPAQTVVADLLVDLLPEQADKDYEWLYYGLVTADGGKIGSSNGEVIWIDDFLDELAASPAVSALERLGDGRVSRAELADILARANFLCAPMAQPMTLAAERLLADESGPAWTIAEAWSRAHAVDSAARSGTVARAGVMQSQRFRMVLGQALAERDPGVLATYLLRLSEAFLAAPEPGPAARPVLQRVLASLGFAIPLQAPRAAGIAAPAYDDRPTVEV